MRCLVPLLALVASCGDNRAAALAIDAPPLEDHALGMNDVSILVPLPASLDAPVLGKATDFVPQEAYDELIPAFGDIGPKEYMPFGVDDFHVVAVRFDLCARSEVGPCPPVANGRLRMVLQPLYPYHGAPIAMDIAIHAFFSIPYTEMDAAITELRALARIANTPGSEPLELSPPLAAGNAEYRDRLKVLLARYATPDAFVRLTVIGQEVGDAASEWLMRGLDAVDGKYQRIAIPQIGEFQQHVNAGGGIFSVRPIADHPIDIALGINFTDFRKASPHDQQIAYQALLDVQNPLKHDAVDTQCAACHVANFSTWQRVEYMGGRLPGDIPGGFVSAGGRDTNAISDANTSSQVIRVFGWSFDQPIVTMRVANDTAEVLDEIDAHR